MIRHTVSRIGSWALVCIERPITRITLGGWSLSAVTAITIASAMNVRIAPIEEAALPDESSVETSTIGPNSPTAPAPITSVPNGVESSSLSRRIGISVPSAVVVRATPTSSESSTTPVPCSTVPSDNPIAIDDEPRHQCQRGGLPWILWKSISMPAMKNRNDRPSVEKNATTVVSSARSNTFGPIRIPITISITTGGTRGPNTSPPSSGASRRRHKDHHHGLVVTHGATLHRTPVQSSRDTAPMPAIIGVDVGGTFTDVALVHERRLVLAKVSTTVPDQSLGVLAGVAAALERAGLTSARRRAPRPRYHGRDQRAAGAHAARAPRW